MVDVYCHPSELIDLTPVQVHDRQPDVRLFEVALVVNPTYVRRYIDTGELDKSILVNTIGLVASWFSKQQTAGLTSVVAS